MFVFAQTGSAQNNQLNFGENYFVSGDYVVAGVGLRGLGGKNGYATQQLTMSIKILFLLLVCQLEPTL